MEKRDSSPVCLIDDEAKQLLVINPPIERNSVHISERQRRCVKEREIMVLYLFFKHSQKKRENKLLDSELG